MNLELVSCKNCGSNLTFILGQKIITCPHCKTKYYIDVNFPDAINLKEKLDMYEAENIFYQSLNKNKAISRSFIKEIKIKDIDLFFIPFIETRGIKVNQFYKNEKLELNYISFQQIECANDLKDFSGLIIDPDYIEDALLKAEQIDFDPIKLRKKGNLIEITQHILDTQKNKMLAEDFLESSIRIVYFPIWKITYVYKNIVFESYISAIDGKVFKISGIKNHKKKAGYALIGLMFAGILLPRTAKFLLFMSLSSFMLIVNILIFTFILSFISLLIPYFWELYAFKEIVDYYPNYKVENPINYQDNFLTNSSKFINKFITEKIKVNIKSKNGKDTFGIKM